jgi:hypothetical protein
MGAADLAVTSSPTAMSVASGNNARAASSVRTAEGASAYAATVAASSPGLAGSANSSSVATKGGEKRGGVGSLFRIGASKAAPPPPVSKTPDAAKGSAQPGTPSTDQLPRGMALDYESASRLLSRLQAAGAQVAAQKQVILDLTEKLRTADTVKDFLSKAVAEKEEAAKAAMMARDALIAQAGIDREVLSFLDDKSTELEQEGRRLAAERDEAVAAASEVRHAFAQLRVEFDAAGAAASTATRERDEARREIFQLQLQLRELDQQRAVAVDTAAAAEARAAQYESMLTMGDAASAPAVGSAAANQRSDQRSLEAQLDASRTTVAELEAALRLAERETASAVAERKTTQRRIALLEEQVAAAASAARTAQSAVGEVATGSAIPVDSPAFFAAGACSHVDADARLQELLVEREAKWKTERKTLAMEIRRLRAEKDALVAQAALPSPPPSSTEY